MWREERRRQRLGRQRAEIAGSERRPVGCVIGVEPGAFEPRDVRQVFQMADRCETGEKIREIIPIFEDEPRARRMRAQEIARDHAKILVPEDLRHPPGRFR